MRWRRMVCLAAVILLAVSLMAGLQAGEAEARWYGGGFRGGRHQGGFGHHGFRSGHHLHGSGVFVGLGLGFAGFPYAYPGYYSAYPAYPAYAYPSYPAYPGYYGSCYAYDAYGRCVSFYPAGGGYYYPY